MKDKRKLFISGKPAKTVQAKNRRFAKLKELIDAEMLDFDVDTIFLQEPLLYHIYVGMYTKEFDVQEQLD